MAIRISRFSAIGALCFGFLLACGPAGSEGDPTSSLATTAIPEGFDFATTRPVSLVVARAEVQAIDVRTPDGACVYRGPALAGLSFTLPTKDAHLDVDVTDSHGASARVRVPVTAGVARLQ